MNIMARLMRRSERDGECLVWTGQRHGGYGYIHIGGRRDGKMQFVHRVAWIERHGPIPDGLLVLHRCDNPPCFLDEHLWLGTDADNCRDMIEKQRAHWHSRTHCPHGHLYDDENTYWWRGKRLCRACRAEVEKRRIRDRRG